MTDTELEELAKKLFAIMYGNPGWKWDQVDDAEHKLWFKMSREVAAMVVEARLEELDNTEFYSESSIYLVTKAARLTDLQTQLTALRGEEKT